MTVWESPLAVILVLFHFDILSIQNPSERRKETGLAESHKIMLYFGHLDSFIYIRNTFEHLLLARHFIPKCGDTMVYQLENAPVLKELKS